MKKLLTLAALLLLAVVGRADAVFIANPATTESALSADDAKNLLLGNKTRWESGPIVKLIVQTEGTLHDGVIKSFTQRTADQFDKYWKRQVFTGKGTMPAQAKTDAEVVDYVAKTPGALGYIAKSSATAGVKVLASP